MSAPAPAVHPVRDLAELRRHFAAGEKPPASHRLGVEHEKIVVLPDGSAPSYDGAIGGLVSRLVASDHGWTPVLEDGRPIALRRVEALGGGSVTPEPGG